MGAWSRSADGRPDRPPLPPERGDPACARAVSVATPSRDARPRARGATPRPRLRAPPRARAGLHGALEDAARALGPRNAARLTDARLTGRIPRDAPVPSAPPPSAASARPRPRRPRQPGPVTGPAAERGRGERTTRSPIRALVDAGPTTNRRREGGRRPRRRLRGGRPHAVHGIDPSPLIERRGGPARLRHETPRLGHETPRPRRVLRPALAEGGLSEDQSEARAAPPRPGRASAAASARKAWIGPARSGLSRHRRMSRRSSALPSWIGRRLAATASAHVAGENRRGAFATTSLCAASMAASSGTTAISPRWRVAGVPPGTSRAAARATSRGSPGTGRSIRPRSSAPTPPCDGRS